MVCPKSILCWAKRKEGSQGVKKAAHPGMRLNTVSHSCQQPACSRARPGSNFVLTLFRTPMVRSFSKHCAKRQWPEGFRGLWTRYGRGGKIHLILIAMEITRPLKSYNCTQKWSHLDFISSDQCKGFFREKVT